MYKEHTICVSPLIICLSFKFLWFFLLVCFYSMWSLWIAIYTVISKNPRKFIVSLKGYMFYIFCWLDNLKHLSLASMFGRSSLLTKKLEMTGLFRGMITWPDPADVGCVSCLCLSTEGADVCWVDTLLMRVHVLTLIETCCLDLSTRTIPLSYHQVNNTSLTKILIIF